MKKTPNLYTLDQLMRRNISGALAEINGKWVDARPIGYWSFKYRCKCAWLVFTGQADAVTWPEGQ